MARRAETQNQQQQQQQQQQRTWRLIFFLHCDDTDY
jgi:hypothetical protein